MNRKTLLFVVSGAEGYGVRHVWALLSKIFIRMGFDIVIAVLNKKFVESWRQDFGSADVIHPPSVSETSKCRKVAFGSLQIALRGVSQFKYLKWLTEITRGRSAVAIVYQGPLESAICGVVARRCRIPALWFVPNVIGTGRFLNLNQKIYRTLFRFGNVIPLSNSHYTNSTFGDGCFRRHVVHLGIDTDFFCPTGTGVNVRSQYGIPQSATVVGLFARMTDSKGQKRLVEAMPRLPCDLHVLLCGGPLDIPYYQHLLTTIAQLGMSERVHIAGPQNDLREYFAACSVVVNLLEGPEGFGLTVVEAMACGKPVLAHALGGPAETIQNGTTGWFINGYGEVDIVDGFQRVFADRARWCEMGAAGRVRVIKEFSISRFQERIEEVVGEELARFDRAKR